MSLRFVSEMQKDDVVGCFNAFTLGRRKFRSHTHFLVLSVFKSKKNTDRNYVSLRELNDNNRPIGRPFRLSETADMEHAQLVLLARDMLSRDFKDISAAPSTDSFVSLASAAKKGCFGL